MLLIVTIAILIVALVFDVPIAFALILAAAVGLYAMGGIGLVLSTFSIVPFSTVSSFVLVAIPLYIMMGHFSFVAGIGEKAYEVGYKLLGGLKGGLAMASVLACGVFAATTGSSVACAAAVGKFAIPEMQKKKYDSALACGAVAAGGTLGILIPPSIAMILYGSITGESVGKLLIAGIIPGIISIIFYWTTIGIWTKIDPNAAPRSPGISIYEKLRGLPRAWGIVVLMFVAVGTIYFGIATPTEASACGVFAALLFALPRIRRNVSSLYKGLLDTVQTTCMVFAVMVGASVYGSYLVQSGVAPALASWAVSLDVPRGVILAISLFIWLPLGLFLDGTSILLITLPIVYPVIKGLGYDLIWYGVLTVKVIEMDLLTPPVALNILVIKGIVPDVPLEKIIKGVIPFLIADLGFIILITWFPEIVLWLPNKMF